jgi:small-conductance mechanosensitive channel
MRDAASWQALMNHLLLFLPRLITALIVLVGFWAVAAAVQRVVDRTAKGRGLDAGLTVFLSRAAKVLLLFVGLVVALGTVGIDVTALVAGLGLTGFAIGFALKDIISNALSGILILIYKPFHHGDHIAVDTH